MSSLELGGVCPLIQTKWTESGKVGTPQRTLFSEKVKLMVGL